MRLRDRLPVLWTGDRFLVLLFLIVLVGYGLAALQLRAGLMSDVVGPKSFPLLLTGFGLILVALFFRRALLTETPPARRGWRLSARLRQLQPLLLLLVYVLALEPFGYPLATFVFAAVALRALGYPSLAGTLAFAAGLAAASYGLFALVFDVALPTGSLFAALW